MQIWLLLGPDQKIGQMVTAQLSFNRLCDLLMSIANYRFGSDSDDFKSLSEIVKRARASEGKRNQQIHSFWAVNHEQIGDGQGTSSSLLKRMKWTAKEKGLEIQEQNLSVDELTAIANEVRAVASELVGWMSVTKLPEGIIQKDA